jgi:signal transduction histidine kinase/DNA-binding response OmpR family regulator
MFRHGDGGVVGLPITALVHPSYHGEYIRYAAASLGSGGADASAGELEVEGVRAYGSGFPMAISTRRMRLDEREMFTSVVRDITERKAADRLKDEFISTVSHELRTPLTAIQGALGLVVEGSAGELPTDAQKLLGIAYNNGDRLVRLINDILDIQKIESGKMALADERLRVRHVLRQAIEANQAYADQYDVSIRMDDPADDPWICADTDRIMQVMANLLSNAAKFSPKGGRVVIGAMRRNGMARISVTDQGMGIPTDARETLFDKFTQVDARLTRDRGGTGLGLSICKAIVERMGGAIDYESEVGEGTTFYVDLPEWRAPDIVAGSDGAEDGSSRVLVCEDDPDVAALLARMLEEAGFSVDVAHTAGQAMDALEANPYDAMTLDLLLPDRDGVDFLRQLRETEKGGRLAVVIVSAVADAARQELNGAALQVIDWIGKPIDQRRLVDAVGQATQTGSDGLPSILHVEDDPNVAQVVHALLRDVADITHAADLQTGIEALGQASFDLVILDIALPDGSGLEALGHVGTTPVVIFAAEEADPAADERVAAALVKSRAGNAELLRTISSLIGEANS